VGPIRDPPERRADATDFAYAYFIESFQNLVVLQFGGLFCPVTIVGLPQIALNLSDPLQQTRKLLLELCSYGIVPWHLRCSRIRFVIADLALPEIRQSAMFCRMLCNLHAELG